MPRPSFDAVMNVASTDKQRKRLAAALVATIVLIAGAGLLVAGATDETKPAEAAPAGAKIETITVQGLHERLAGGGKPLLVDVREPWEYEAVHIDGVLLAPLATVEKALESTDRNREIVLVCRSGRRSGKAYQSLAARGFTSMKNLEGGMLAWEKAGYPVVKKRE